MTSIFLVFCILLLFESPKDSQNTSAKFNKIVRYWSCCTRNFAITNGYFSCQKPQIWKVRYTEKYIPCSTQRLTQVTIWNERKKRLKGHQNKIGYIMFDAIDHLKWKKKKFELSHWVKILLVLSSFFEKKIIIITSG